MKAPQNIAAQGETPTQINSGAVCLLGMISAHNPSDDPAAGGAYVKIYAKTTAPDGSDVPIWSHFVPGGAVGSQGVDRLLPVFGIGAANLWIAVSSTGPAAGLAAPDQDFAISIQYAP